MNWYVIKIFNPNDGTMQAVASVRTFIEDMATAYAEDNVHVPDGWIRRIERAVTAKEIAFAESLFGLWSKSEFELFMNLPARSVSEIDTTKTDGVS